MAKTLICKLHHEWGERVSVGGHVYEIGKDGRVVVEDAHAAALLQNTGKWADASDARMPFRRPTGVPSLILEDRQGRIVPQDEADALVAAAQAKVTVPVEEAEPPPSEDWPEVSMLSKKELLLSTCRRLAEAGFLKKEDAVKGKELDGHTKPELLELIERAYDRMGAAT